MTGRWGVSLCVLVALLALCPCVPKAQEEPLTLVVQMGPDVGQNQGLVWHGDGDWDYRFDGQAQLPFGHYVSIESGLPVECRAFLRFPLDGLPPGAEVLSATLELYVDDWPFAGSGLVGVYPVQATWTEPFTWTTQPPIAATPIFSQTLASHAGWTAWNVTDLVESWAGGEDNHGLVLAAAPSAGTLIGWAAAARGRTDTRDSALLPRLVIAYRQPPTPTPSSSPTPTATPGLPPAPPVVPEPSTWLLFSSTVTGLAAYAGLQARARRRR